MRGFTYKCVQADLYPPLSPLLINMTRENLLGTQTLFESLYTGSNQQFERTGQVRDELHLEYSSPLNMVRCLI